MYDVKVRSHDPRGSLKIEKANINSWCDLAGRLMRQKGKGTYRGTSDVKGRYTIQIIRTRFRWHVRFFHAIQTQLEGVKGWQLALLRGHSYDGKSVTEVPGELWLSDCKSLQGELAWNDSVEGAYSQFSSKEEAWRALSSGRYDFRSHSEEPPKVETVWDQIKRLPRIEGEAWSWSNCRGIAEEIRNAGTKSNVVRFIRDKLVHVAVLTCHRGKKYVSVFEPGYFIDWKTEKVREYGLSLYREVQDLKTKQWQQDPPSLPMCTQMMLKDVYEKVGISRLLKDRPMVTRLSGNE